MYKVNTDIITRKTVSFIYLSLYSLTALIWSELIWYMSRSVKEMRIQKGEDLGVS